MRACEQRCLFIMDEVVTGFRFGFGGVSAMAGITPDLYCWGKALSNGFCLSAIVGRKDVMEFLNKGVFFSGTFFDDPFSLYAGYLTVIEMLKDQHIFSRLS